MPKNDLYSFEFISLCTITFLALCNIAAFYNFHLYLQDLGFHGKQAGFLIGLYSLTAMILYVFVSRHIIPSNSFACMRMGMLITVGCGAAYLFADNFWLLVLVRIANGAGIFLIMASCMVVLVTIIPADKTGLAFSLYSVALLLPYSIMPAVSEMVLPLTDSPTRIYLASAGLLLPGAGLVTILGNRITLRSQGLDNRRVEPVTKGGERKNLLRKPVVCILLANGIYFTIFSSLFFLFEGLGIQRGIENPGFFFTIQMAVMIVIRLFGGRIFDKYSKVGLVTTALLVTGLGFFLLKLILDPAWIFPIAVVFGLGMGLCVPPLNSLMYLVSWPQYRGYNANMMMLSIHLGTFLGPFIGAWIIDSIGYDRFLLVCALFSAAGAGFFFSANPAKTIPADITRK